MSAHAGVKGPSIRQELGGCLVGFDRPRDKRAASRACDFPRIFLLMPIERTFSILKPDATRRNLTGAINALIEAAGLRIVAQKRVVMTRGQAETFYAIHKERPFFGELV